MEKLNRDTITKLALDSMMHLSEAEINEIETDSAVYLKQIEYLKAVDIEGVESLSYPFEAETMWLRSDDTSYALAQETLFKNVPLTEGDYVEIVKVLK